MSLAALDIQPDVLDLSTLLRQIMKAQLGHSNLKFPHFDALANQSAIFLLVDGLGAVSLAQYISEYQNFLSMSALGNLQTTFPSTTASALTSLSTAVAPGSHGMLGYTTKVPNSGWPPRLLNALKWDSRVDPQIWQAQPTLFERPEYAGIKVSYIAAKRYEGSGFTEATLRGAKYVGANRIESMVGAARELLAQNVGPQLIYMYVNFVDQAGHSDGVGSDRWRESLAQVDLLIGLIRAELKAPLVVSADHGMLSSERKIVVDNQLMKGVELLGGEPRMRHLYLSDSAPSAIASVKENWQRILGDQVLLLNRNESGSLFGGVSARNQERVGDLIAIPQADWLLIEYARLEQEGAMKGHHGGASEIETKVPLLVAGL